MFIHKYREKKRKYFCLFRIMLYLCSANDNGAIAQMVEQRTENPCVPGSIPGGTTLKKLIIRQLSKLDDCFFSLYILRFPYDLT